MPDDDPEPGVCVCCKAKAETRHCLSETWQPEVCNECKDDGTYRDWLADQLEVAMLASGRTYTVDEHGNKLFSVKPAA